MGSTQATAVGVADVAMLNVAPVPVVEGSNSWKIATPGKADALGNSARVAPVRMSVTVAVKAQVPERMTTTTLAPVVFTALVV